MATLRRVCPSASIPGTRAAPRSLAASAAPLFRQHRVVRPAAPCRAAEEDEYPTSLVVAGALGLAAEAEVARSLAFLSQNGCGLPSGAWGVQGLVEGLSYLGVVAVLGASAITKVQTGSGLPTGGYKVGPGILLGLAEGFAYLYVLAGGLFLSYALTNGGISAVLPPPGEMCESYDREAGASALNALDPCTYNPSICVR